jgi:hypothetical protein
MALSKLKAGFSLVDALAQLTGRQIKKLAEKLGLDPKRNLDANRLKTAVADEGQKYIKQKNKDSDRLVGGAALTAGASVAYSAGDFIRDMLGIKTLADSTLGNTASAKSVADKPNKNKSDIKPPTKKPKTYRTEDGKVLTEKQYLKYLDQNKDRLAKIKKVAEKVSEKKGNKGMLVKRGKRFGHTDYRKGGMVY